MFMFKCSGNREFTNATALKIKAIMQTYYFLTFPAPKIGLQARIQILDPKKEEATLC